MLSSAFMLLSTRHMVPYPQKHASQIITQTWLCAHTQKTQCLLGGSTQSGLSASSAFLQIYTQLLFPISTWLSSVKTILSHWQTTCQFFLSLHKSTYFFLLTSWTTIFIFETCLCYLSRWSPCCKVLWETGLSKPSLNELVTSLDFFTNLDHPVLPLLHKIPLLSDFFTFSVEPVWWNVFKTPTTVVLGVPNISPTCLWL